MKCVHRIYEFAKQKYNQVCEQANTQESAHARVADARLGEALAAPAELHVIRALGVSVREASPLRGSRCVPCSRPGRRRNEPRSRYGGRKALPAAEWSVAGWLSHCHEKADGWSGEGWRLLLVVDTRRDF